MATPPTPLAAEPAAGQQDTQQLRKALSKYALPSASELRHLRAADPSSSYRSSFFRLQVDELLAAVGGTPGAKASAGIQTLLFEVKHVLEALGAQQVTQEALQARGLCVRNHIKRKEVVLPFSAPARLDVVGSYILQTMAFARKSRSDDYGVLSIDLAVEMPASCFLPKDFANYRYADKRNLYLGVLAAELQSHSELFASVSLSALHGDVDRPVAVLQATRAFLAANGLQGAQLCVRVLPVLAPGVFKLAKLAPSRNNIRHHPNMTEAETRQCRTPHYNNAILEDLLVRQHTRELHAALKASPALAEACVLAKVWLRQRGFHRAPDSLNGFLLAMLLLYLFQQRRVSAHTPSDQMFKVLVQFLAVHDLEAEPLQFAPAQDGGVLLTAEGLQTFRASFDLVVLDSSGRLNLFGRVSRSAWRELQAAARQAVQLVQRGSMDAFRALFISKQSFWTRYDQFFWFPAPPRVEDADSDAYTAEERREIHDVGLQRFWTRKLEAVLAQALSDRVQLVRPLVEPSRTWPLLAEAPPAPRKVAVGLRLDAAQAWRLVDKGPAAEDKAASAPFRAFWRGKSELRRFKDGAILEAVVWDDVTAETRHRVLDVLVQFIVPAHCPQLSAADIKTSNAALYSALDVEEPAALHRKKPSTHGAAFESTLTGAAKLWVVFNSLAKTLRALESLPLQVSDVRPVHPAFRATSLFPVQPHPFAFSKGDKMDVAPMPHVNTVLEPLLLHVTFERSSSWPSEKQALRHAKAGFYVHLAHELERRQRLRCEVGTDGVDVFLGGYVFRLVIRSEKELSVATGARRLALGHSREYVTAKREADYVAKHANTVHALQSKNASFGPTVRLAQRWLADKALSNVLAVEAVELLVADVFLSSTVAFTPHSVLSGFLRFLERVATFDWANAPLIVDLNDALDDAKRREILKRFEASSTSAATHPAMFLAADYEEPECLSSWTRFSPDKVVVQRLVALAHASYDLLVAWLAAGASSSGWKAAFAGSKAEFDARLELATEHLPTKKMRVEGGKKQPFVAPVYKNMDLTAVPVLVGFDPVRELVQDLERKFGHLAFFFLNGVERREILLAWKPQAFLPAKFRAIASNYLMPLPSTSAEGDDDSGRSYAVPNIFEVLSDMQRMSHGMVRAVELHPFESA